MILYMIKKFDEFINENIFDGIGKRSKGGIVRKENYVEQVDLGLPSGTIWATCNLGASSPEEYGNYYAWGETKQKDDYDFDNYKFGTEDNYTKYNKKDGKTILDLEDDAANAVLGGKWHMPTKEQIQELIDNTTNKVIELNGVKGNLFTSKKNGNTLFFPFSGGKTFSKLSGEGLYSSFLSSSLYTPYKDSNYARIFSPNSNYQVASLEISPRFCGISVRGVFEKK